MVALIEIAIFLIIAGVMLLFAMNIIWYLMIVVAFLGISIFIIKLINFSNYLDFLFLLVLLFYSFEALGYYVNIGILRFDVDAILKFAMNNPGWAILCLIFFIGNTSLVIKLINYLLALITSLIFPSKINNNQIDEYQEYENKA